MEAPLWPAPPSPRHQALPQWRDFPARSRQARPAAVFVPRRWGARSIRNHLRASALWLETWELAPARRDLATAALAAWEAPATCPAAARPLDPPLAVPIFLSRQLR